MVVKPTWEEKLGTVSLAASSPTCIVGNAAGVADIFPSSAGREKSPGPLSSLVLTCYVTDWSLALIVPHTQGVG